jgi:membrane-associated protein
VNGIKLGIYIVLFIVLQKQVFCWILLPGDSLLFLAGIYNRELIENIVFIDSDFINVILLSTLVGIAGVLGILLVIGLERKVVIIYTIKKTLLVQEKYLVQSKDFFEKHGGRAIIFARFFTNI